MDNGRDNKGRFTTGNTGRPKVDHAGKLEQAKKAQALINRGCDIVDEHWDDIVRGMCQQAKRSPQAAVWIRDTFIGKPKETQIIEDANGEGLTIVYAKHEARDAA